MPPPDRLARFTPAERMTHRATAALCGVLAVTGMTLYLPSLSLLVGRRPLVEGAHVVAGLLLPLPTLAALLSPAFRADLAVLNRFTPADRQWLRRTPGPVATGKFNAGQKLAAAAFAAAGVLLLGTGIMLTLPTQLGLSDSLRQGATLVHDTVTLALLALLGGHAYLAYRHPEARAALRTGSMDAGYALQHHPAWVSDRSP
jgi:formate dehydrogenase subunit gamma